MLPDILAGSYKRYKQDTTVFTTWLSQAAIACGYKSLTDRAQNNVPARLPQALSLAPRLKGKARKEAKAAAVENTKPPAAADPSPTVVRYEVTTQELLNQASAVAMGQNAGIKVPGSVVRVVERLPSPLEKDAPLGSKPQVSTVKSNRQTAISVLSRSWRKRLRSWEILWIDPQAQLQRHRMMQ